MFADTAPEGDIQNNPPSAPQGPNVRNPRTCVTCKRRKVKCDRISPCSNCVKAQIQCKYPPPGRAPRQPRRGMRLPEKGNLPELVDQVWALMVRAMEQSINPESAAFKQFSAAASSSQPREGRSSGDQAGKQTAVRVVGMDEGTGSRSENASRDMAFGSGLSHAQEFPHPVEGMPGQLYLGQGKSQYIPSPFWASMSEVCIACLSSCSIAKIILQSIKEGIQEILEEHEDESEDDTSFMPTEIPTENNHHSFIMGYNSSEVDLKRLHPPRSQIPIYWQTFQANVNPVTKLVHVPTMNRVIADVQNNLDLLSPSTEALMFSIYFATIISMTPEDASFASAHIMILC
jgi:hypothetical protein